MSDLVTAAEREAARLRDRLAEIEVEQATLEAELAAFNSDYMRVVMTVMLDVQELDSSLDTLRHKLGTIPEAAQRRELAERRTTVDNAARDLRIEVDDLTREQKRADADVEQVKTRRERDRSRMDSGQITNPKDLERMQHELVSLERRISTLEDAELEVMEKLEEAQQLLAGLGIRAEEDTRLAANWIRSQQRDDGTWANFYGGPGELSTTVEAYAALRLAGDPADAEHLRRAREWIRDSGGVEQFIKPVRGTG